MPVSLSLRAGKDVVKEAAESFPPAEKLHAKVEVVEVKEEVAIVEQEPDEVSVLKEVEEIQVEKKCVTKRRECVDK